MDSCATVEYKTIEEKSNLINEFETVKHNTKNNILNGLSVDEYNKFYQNNTTIMMTQEAKGYESGEKASGSLKITSFKGNLMKYYNYTVFENCCYPELFSGRFNSNNMSIYSNEDKSYIYASVDLNRGGYYGDSEKYLSIRENSLVSYYGEARSGLSYCLGYDKIDGYTDVKLEY
jgi:hypothetical protein